MLSWSSMAWRLCNAPDPKTLFADMACRGFLKLSFVVFLIVILWAKNENMQLLLVSWHEPSTFLTCFCVFFFLFGCTEHFSKYRMVQHYGQGWDKIKFSINSLASSSEH